MISLHLPFDKLPLNPKIIYLAYSGGIDSSVLLHALYKHKPQLQLVVWHINHGLQKDAARMESFARRQAAQFGVEFRVDHLHMDSSAGNLEAKARDHRYRLFESALNDNDVLLTAHHENDQAETLLLNLMRGSGSSGLRAIAAYKSLGKGFLFRPLIDYTRKEIEQYAQFHQIDWIEDPSNKSINLDRNYLRHVVLPVITKRWPAAIQQLHRASELQNESEQLLSDLARIDYARALVSCRYSSSSCLSIEVLSGLSEVRKKNLIRYWIKLNRLSVIGFHKIEELLKQLDCRVDAMPFIEGNEFSIRWFKNTLYLVKKPASIALEPSYSVPAEGKLEITAISFEFSRQEIFSYLNRADKGEQLDLKFRQANRPGQAVSHSHRLKRLFQKHQIPPWIRSHIPQIFVENELVDLWLL